MLISKPARICAASYGLIPEPGKIAHARFWPIADKMVSVSNVRFRGRADIQLRSPDVCK
jgi:hypothetical protein